MKNIRQYLIEFNFEDLFTELLLWDRFRAKHVFEVAGQFYEVAGIAEKRGLVAFLCRPAPNQPFPGSADRKRIEREVDKLHHEHIIIFTDRLQTRQVWQVPKRDGGKTKGTSEIPFYLGRGVEHLARRIQKLSFSLEESETTTIVEVAARVNQALLAERVTKKFFKEFNDHRKSFVMFLDWIEDESKRDWYCSVLLNRLMFVYFLGEKGFMPGGASFLRTNLTKNIAINGNDTFYTHFLLPLSFFGLGERRQKRGRFEETFRDVLYLDGGLFAVHKVERELGINKEAVEKGVYFERCKIPDSEFRKWFDYFDKWRWTLDENKVENEGYISPHILGYIFEKYINQKQMGAYYTKEDITGYSCRNTIIPRLFDMLADTGEKGKKSVRPLPIGPQLNLFNEGRGISDGEGIDRYIYLSVKQEEALPGEADYEQEQRRTRYEMILSDFDSDRILGIDNFITYNLDIEKLVLDFISNIQDTEVLHAFYFRCLRQITVLDPTCGSGAFLFEALVILYPLYNACLSRMRYILDKAIGIVPDIVNWGGRLHFDDLEIDQSTLVDLIALDYTNSKVLNDLQAEVQRINDHPSAEYFIKKSIIVNNLFGVDIMEEAVEICKLRLFLTLISTVERDDSKENFGVEPLPDIDFNILSGNTLVGYTGIADIDRLWHEIEVRSSTFAFEKDHTRLKTLISEYGRLLDDWRLQQLNEPSGTPVTKEQVLAAVESVRPDLDKDIWRLYRTAGFATKEVKDNTGKSKYVELTQAEFKRTHEPFHWFLEFPSIEANGGFDVVIGNPPFLETRDVVYDPKPLKTRESAAIHAMCCEVAIQLLKTTGYISMVMPMSIVSTQRMKHLQSIIENDRSCWYIDFAWRPAKLFDAVNRAITVFVAGRTPEERTWSTGYRKWSSETRGPLFELTKFVEVARDRQLFWVPKLSDAIEPSLLDKVLSEPGRLAAVTAEQGARVYYRTTGGLYWKVFTDFPPAFTINGQAGVSSRQTNLTVKSPQHAQLTVAILSSSLFWWWYTISSNLRDLNPADIAGFPIPRTVWDDTNLLELAISYINDIKTNSKMLRRIQRQTGVTETQSFSMARSKPIIDMIDAELCSHYGLSNEQIRYIQEYDCKFRLNSLEDDNADE